MKEAHKKEAGMKSINKFQDGNGQHLPLSNFYRVKFFAPHYGESSNPVAWETAEHYYQAAKALRRIDGEAIRLTATPGQSKRLGRQVVLRPDWESEKFNVMRKALQLKFAPGSGMGEYLLATGTAVLIEGNTWGDVVWGKCNGKGRNWLGWLLAAQRDYLRCVTPQQQKLL